MERKTIQILSISLFVAMLLWGVWTLLYYLGLPIHGAVLLPDEVMQSLGGMCDQGALICRGAYSLFSVIWNSLTRVPFLVWYAVACAVIYAAVLGWRYVRTMKLDTDIVMRPWKIVLLFLFPLWLIFTCLSVSKNGDMPFSRLIEPVAQVYQGAGSQALQELRNNFDDLKNRGCLVHIGTFSNIAEATDIKFSCFQISFFRRVLTPALGIIVFLFELIVLGRFLFRKLLGNRSEGSLEEFVVSLGIGMCAWIAILWGVAVAGIFTAMVGWGLAILVPLALYRDSVYWIMQSHRAEWRVQCKWWSPLLLLAWFLISYLALNFLNVVRPFPIGWDDLGSYLNRPRQLVSYGHFIFPMSAFQWEYLTAIGFLLFGFNSTFGATMSLLINWTEGLMAVFIVYLLVRTYLGRGTGILSAILYYTLPLVGHFSFADMKIDNAVFSAGAFAMFAMLRGVLPREEEEVPFREKLAWVALSGIFCGFAFGMKVTAIMVFMALGAVLLGGALHPVAFFGAIIFACAVFTQQGAFNMAALLTRVGANPDFVSPLQVAIVMVVVGCIPLGIGAWYGRARLKSAAIVAAFFIAGFSAAIFPWIEHNSIEYGHVIPGMYLSAKNNVGPILDAYGSNPDATYSLPPELQVDRKNPLCKATGAEEELGRYWGDRRGWGHYVTLPFRVVMNIDSVGYYVTTQPGLLLFPLLILLPYFWRKEGKWFRWLWLATAFLVFEWVFLANGIPWYGVGMFLGLAVSLEVLVAKAPDGMNKTVASLLVAISVILCLGQRLWQFESQRNLFEYALGKVSATALRERTIPYYDDITEVVLARAQQMPDRPLLYRIGTFMPYFIPRSLEVIGTSDHQLDFFNCLYQDRDAAKMTERLKKLGFQGIVFDTNTATIEKDERGSLHEKVQIFADYINNPKSGLKVVINDAGAGVAFILIP